MAKIWNRYNQVPDLNRDNTWESDKTEKRTSQTSKQGGHPFHSRWPQDSNNGLYMQALRFGIIRALNDSAERLPSHSTDKTTLIIKVSKKAKIRNRYNQVPHPTQDNTWERDKKQENFINKQAKRSVLSQQVTTRWPILCFWVTVLW